MSEGRRPAGPFRLPVVPGKRATVRSMARKLPGAILRTLKAVLVNAWVIGIIAGLIAIWLGALLLHIG